MSSNLEDEYFAKEDALKLHKIHAEKEKHDQELLAKAEQDPRYVGIQWAAKWLADNGATVQGECADSWMMKAFMSEFENSKEKEEE